jgi:BlaI family penicillinase repressor
MPTVDPDSDPVRLGDLQLAILRVLWAEGEATVNRVHAVVAPERGSAASTIATMLTKMEARGLVRHRKSGRQFVYRARIAEADAKRSMVRDVTSRLFRGDPLALVSHLVREEELGPDDLEAIRAMIERHTKSARASASEDERDELPAAKEVG